MRARLVGHDVDRGAAAQQLREDVGAVAEQADAERPVGARRELERVVDVVGLDVQVAGLEPALDAGRVDLDADRHAAGHRHRERLRAAHPAQAAGERDRAGQGAAVALVRDRRERLVGALQDALGADVDPRARGHLAVHRQPERLEAPELVPVRPVAHEVGVRDQHARRPLVRLHDADGLAGLHEQRLVVRERLQRAARSRGTRSSRARPCPSRRRRRARRGARRRRGPGCCGACAGRLPAASPGRRARCLGRRG